MIMRCLLLLGCLWLPIVSDAAATASTAPPASGETLRLQRLAAVAALWNEVKYFHPYVATRPVDWDKALVDTLPRINAAKTSDDYRAAVDGMLAALDDPSTRTLDAPGKALPNAKADPSPMVRMAAGVLHVDIARLSAAVDASGSNAAGARLLQPALEAMPKAKSVVIDARAALPSDPGGAATSLMQMLLNASSNRPLQLGSMRYRSHNGYPTQTGSYSSGGYVSGMITEQPTVLPGLGKQPLPPMRMLINANSTLSAEMIAGLHAIGARIVSEGKPTEVDASPHIVELGEGVRAQMRTTELVSPDGSVGLQLDGAGSGGKAIAPMRSTIDSPYAEMKFPAVEYRLLALFRFWGVIDNFFAYKHLIGPSWDDVLVRYIPRFEANRNIIDYQLTVRALATETHDSHSFLGGGFTESAAHLGRNLPPVELQWIQGQTVVAKLPGDDIGLRVGDIVRTVDGRPVSELRDYLGGFIAASTPQAWQRDIQGSLLRGPADSRVHLGVTRSDGKPRDVVLIRSMLPGDPKWQQLHSAAPPLPVFGVLPDGSAYVDLGRLQRSEVNAMFDAIKGTRATIFDMRSYPNGTAWSIAPRLTKKKNVVGAQFLGPMVDGRGRDDSDLRNAKQAMEQRLPPAEGPPYLGRVVMLVNEQTQSQAEHTGLFFEAATDVTFIGSPTAGANGDVTQMVLPGGLGLSFSGHDVRHADGRQLQRIGLVPHIVVAPTIAGLVAGKDEVLQAALDFLARPD